MSGKCDDCLSIPSPERQISVLSGHAPDRRKGLECTPKRTWGHRPVMTGMPHNPTFTNFRQENVYIQRSARQASMHLPLEFIPNLPHDALVVVIVPDFSAQSYGRGDIAFILKRKPKI